MSTTKRGRCPTCGRRETRSTEANAFYWALLHEIADRLRPQRQTYSADQWHTYFKTRLLGADEMTLPNGKTLLLPHSTADLDTSLFADYVSQVQAWAADHDV